VRAYHRRRGWHAWHVAALSRADPKRFPSLGDLTGEERTRSRRQSSTEMFHNLRLFKAALAVRKGA